MITFKQFLIEGGAATRALNTHPASSDDIAAAIQFLIKHTDLPSKYINDNLLGSAPDILLGRKRKDGKTVAGDIDLGIDLSRFDRDTILSQVKRGLESKKHNSKARQIGASVFSFAVPGANGLVQLDLMFVPNADWGKWAYHSPADSQYSGAVRNILLMAAARNNTVPGKDLEVKNDSGETLVRVRRALKIDSGLERLFKIAQHKKDGTLAKGLVKVSPDEIKARLAALKITHSISTDAENISDPQLAVAAIFGQKIKPRDLLTAEQVITAISGLPNASQIFSDAVSDLTKQKMHIPRELQKFK